MCRLVALSSTISTGRSRSTTEGEAGGVSGWCGRGPERAVKAKGMPRPRTPFSGVFPPLGGTRRAAVGRPRPEPEARREGKGTALTRHAVHGDLPAHEGHQARSDGQAQAGALVLARARGVRLLESLEDS